MHSLLKVWVESYGILSAIAVLMTILTKYDMLMMIMEATTLCLTEWRDKLPVEVTSIVCYAFANIAYLLWRLKHYFAAMGTCLFIYLFFA